MLLLEHQYMITSKTKDVFVRRKAVDVLLSVVRLCGWWRPLSIEVQGNLC
jgi:hypothetical protein